VRYESAAAFHMALEQRMKTEAERTRLNLVRLRKRVAFEMFLRRLVQMPPDRWTLKGPWRSTSGWAELRGRPKTSTSGATTTRRPRSRASPPRSDSGSTTSSPSQQAETDAFDEVDEFQTIRFHVRAALADFLRSGFAAAAVSQAENPSD
jgi:hypothetical protein